MDQDLIARLARAHGIRERYLDFRGDPQPVSLASQAAILRAMSVDPDNHDASPMLLDETTVPSADTHTPAIRCHLPASLASGRRIWGITVQLYALRSASNWGIGDFADLARFARDAAGRGADFVGLNPLHAGFAADPGHCSPYSPSSRHALNVLYIAVHALPDLPRCPAAQTRIAEPEFQQELARLREQHWVDYAGVARLKLRILRLLHARFHDEELAADTGRGRAFRSFVQGRGLVLHWHALFEALDETMRRDHGALGGWPSWPHGYRDPAASAVAAFAASSAEQVEFHAWLQWIAESQLAAATRIARESGMSIGLYGDYAVGANPGGSETWSDPEAYCLGASIGAPPDKLALKGQDWGLPPPHPEVMLRGGCAGFRELMRANMRHFGALRLDHVMSLFRLWWVPQGLPASEGGYVQYPVDQLFRIVAEESRHSGCLVIGENLGTVPEEVVRDMAACGAFGYKVLYFERAADGSFTAPAGWSREALASVSTHDLPSLKAWWTGDDIDLRARLGLYPEGMDLEELNVERDRDRELLLEAMAGAGVRPRWPVEHFEPAFAAAVHAFLASTASALAAVQVEDLLGMTEPVNVPGTSSEYPNWRRRLSADLAGLFDDPAAQPVLETMRRLRPR